MRHTSIALILSCLTLTSFAETIHTPPTSNIVNFESHATREVPNDLAKASLFIELSDSNPAILAEKINLTLAAALKILKAHPSVKSEGTNYSTYPTYSQKSNKQDGWRSRGELRISSKDFPAISKLIGELQKSTGPSTLQLSNVDYSVSDDSRKSLEDILTAECIAEFSRRATLIQKSMSAKGWRMLEMQIRANGGTTAPIRLFAMSKSMESAPAPIDGGNSNVAIHLAASIQLQ